MNRPANLSTGSHQPPLSASAANSLLSLSAAKQEYPRNATSDFKALADITHTKKVRRLAAVLLPLSSTVFHADGNFPGHCYGK